MTLCLHSGSAHINNNKLSISMMAKNVISKLTTTFLMVVQTKFHFNIIMSIPHMFDVNHK